MLRFDSVEGSLYLKFYQSFSCLVNNILKEK